MLPRTFLTAEWRYLALLNYEIEPQILRPYVPHGTEIDLWHGRCYVSIVGFLFLHTRLLGVPIPLHTDFEELNLRFYVRRRVHDGWRRGVVFIKELVPKWAIAMTARLVYNENYHALPMRHVVSLTSAGGYVGYGWRFNDEWQQVQVQVDGRPAPIREDSEESFITEHYWGYAQQRDGSTVEYQVLHPPWRVWQAEAYDLQCDVEKLYGRAFVAPLAAAPSSVFLAEGSAVTVRRGARLESG